jgi:UDP-glucuronate 4-epimerase
MTILITGSAGFIGSHLTERLLALGHRVIGLDNFDSQQATANKRQNVQRYVNSPRFQFVRGDIRDQALIVDLLRQHQCDTVVHLAARAGVRASVNNPGLYLDVNVNGTLAILEAMRLTNVNRLILASSSSVYGNSTRLPFREDDLADQPLSPYAMSKRSAELLARTYHHLHGINISCLRFFTVYGPRQRPEMAISQFIDKIHREQPITLYGDGSTARNYTYISDTVQGIVQALTHLNGFNIFNIGGPSSVTLLDLVDCVQEAMGRRASLDWQPEQAGDVVCTAADNRRASSQLHYQPAVSLQEGLQQCVAWYHTVTANTIAQPVLS